MIRVYRWALLVALLLQLHATLAQTPCYVIDPLLDLPCMCTSQPQTNDVSINCDNVAFPKDFPLLPFKMGIVEYRQRHAGIQGLTGQLFTASDLPLKKVDFSRNMIRRVSEHVWEGLENELEELNLRHNLLGDTYNLLGDSYNPRQVIMEIAKLTNLLRLDLGYNHIKGLDKGLLSNLQNLQLLRLDGNSFINLPTGALLGLDALQVLTLKDNHLESLFEDGLVTTPALEVLDLSENRLTRVMDNSFAGLINLTNLDLSYNKILTLSSGVFKGLHNLEELDLSSNFLAEVPADALKELKNLRILRLDKNLILNLGGLVALGPLQTLHTLGLSRNNIGELPPGTFRQLSGLRSLDLTVNSIRNLEDDTFDGLSSLQELLLDDDDILSIPSSALAKLTSLTTLTLDYNRIGVISATRLQTVTKLRRLSVAHNIIREIPVKTFVNFTQLNELNLYGNKMRNIIPESLIGLRSTLEVLNLGLNLIKELPQFDFPLLKELVLAKNNITTLPSDAFLLLPELQSLDLSDNHLTSLPATIFYSLARLAKVDLSRNEITLINSGQFNDSFVNVINLQHNLINEIPRNAFYNSPLIHTIDLSHNKITTINDQAFHNIPFLHILRLNDNMLTAFKPEYFNLPGPLSTSSLRILDISMNDITFLNPKVFVQHPHITWISFANNRLSFFPSEIVQSLTDLQHLDLEHNVIDILQPEDFANSFFLRELNLKNNMIKSISETAFQNSTQLQELDLSYNNIDNLPENMFLGISRLTIDLSHNNLDSLPLKIFQRTKLQKLQSLDLSFNNFKRVPVSSLKLQYFFLSHLNLAYNNIKDVPNNADLLVNLKSLDLSFNPLKAADVTTLLSEPKLMRHINLSGTNITKLPVIDARFLLTLNLSHNDIVQLEDKSFAVTEHLRVLDVSHNKIPNLSFGLAAAWPKMTGLQELNLSHNPLAYIVKGDLKYLSNLEVLHASYLHRIVKVDRAAMEPLHSLRELHLHTLPNIGELDTRGILEVLQGLEVVDIELTERVVHDHLHPAFTPRLKSLIVRGQKLQALSGGAFAGINSPKLDIGLLNTSISHLRSNVFIPVAMSTEIGLHIDNSQVKSLSHQFIGTLKSRQRHIHLSGLGTNPLFCDCNARDLQTWLIEGGINGPLYNSTCAEPNTLKGSVLTNIDPNELTCKGLPQTTTTDLPSFTTSRRTVSTDNIITLDSMAVRPSPDDHDIHGAHRSGVLTNMDTLIISVVGGVVAFVALIIIIVCLFRCRTDSQYKGGPMAAPCTCLKPPHPPHAWGYPTPYPTLPPPIPRPGSRPGTLKVMPPSTPVPPAYGTVSAHSARSYYSGPPYFVSYPTESDTEHR